MACSNLQKLLNLRTDLENILETALILSAVPDWGRGKLNAIARQWISIKDSIPADYHPVIEDRINACLAYIPKDLWPEEYRSP